LERAVLELCAMHCPKCGRKLEETVYHTVRTDRCTGCGGVWLDPGGLEALAPEEHTCWLGELLARMTSRDEDSR
jgi:Zn-finger nucleic acid-binding protein